MLICLRKVLYRIFWMILMARYIAIKIKRLLTP